MCRSVPQIVVLTILMMASVGLEIFGIGTDSHVFSPGPLYTRAFMVDERVIYISPLYYKLLKPTFSEIPEQHRRAGSPGHQTNHPTYAWVQLVLECPKHHCGY